MRRGPISPRDAAARSKGSHYNDRRMTRKEWERSIVQAQFITWLAGARTRMFIVFRKADLIALRHL